MLQESQIGKIVKRGGLARINRVVHGNIYYKVVVDDESIEDNLVGTYEFCVPLEDQSDATFNYEEKTTFLMRWIRLALQEGTFNKIG